MTKISRNGKMKDHIYEMYHSLVDYPAGETGKQTTFSLK